MCRFYATFYRIIQMGKKMVDLNLPNFITIGLIAILAIYLIRLGFKTAGKNAPI